MKTVVAVSLAFIAALPLQAARAKRPAAHDVSVVTAAHPLEPLTAIEHQAAHEIVRTWFTGAENLPSDALLFPLVVLKEPSKAFVKAWTHGTPFAREATVHVFHAPSNRLWIVTVDLRAQRVTKAELAPAGTQPAVTAEEYVIADELVHAYEPWQEAMRARGVNPDDVYVDIWAPGDLELPANVAASHGSNTRLLRALAFLRAAPLENFDPDNPQNPYDRPIEGVVVTIDMNAHIVVHMTDTVVRPVSGESGNAPAQRTGLKPMRIVQPNGGGFEMLGNRVKWQNWQFYAVLHPREGLVLYDVRYDDHGTLRPIAYRLSLSEIYVPYGVADENWSWRTAFDVGEYNLGQFAQTLEPGADVPEHTHFLDSVFSSDLGSTADNPTGTYDYPATIGIYERDNGILWTRTDPSNYERDTRGRRDLVVTWNAWIGNYIYAFDWIFGEDGGIDVKVVLTGTTLNRGTTDEEEESAPVVGTDDRGVRTAAPNHQHFFSFRLDLDVDGEANTVAESDVRHLLRPGFPNAFGAVETVLPLETFRDADPFAARTWEVRSATKKNKHGNATAFAIETHDIAVPLSTYDYAPLLRAAFASHSFWVTRFRDDERYAAGDFPSQGKAGAGLMSFISMPEPVENADVVVWPTIGLTHVPRPEDYPVMPSESVGLRIVPHGFFDQNPALDAQDLPQTRRRSRAVRP